MKTRNKENTGLFFDSLKDLKNNLSTLIGTELPTLCKVGVKKYKEKTEHKEVRGKSKYQDMTKLGLIDDDGDKFKLTQEGEFFMKNEKIKQNIYDISSKEKLEPIKAQDFISFFDINLSEKNSYRYQILKCLLYYYNGADEIRPFLALLNFIKHFDIKKLDKDVLNNILAHKKEDILLFNYDENAFKKLNLDTQEKINRPNSYIRNFFESALVINSACELIVDFSLVNTLKSEMEHIVKAVEKGSYYNSRPAKAQREFRNSVLKAYGYKCAITNKAIFINERCLLEAAHIIPYKDGGSFSVNNGIALSYEMHKMFDNGLFSFMYNEKGVKIQISKSKQIKDEQGILNDLQDKQIYLPQNEKYHPDKMALEYSLKKILV